jgi:hypothetical protein
VEERLVAPTLSRDQIVKHWLLNLAIECSIPLRVLFPFRWPTRNAREIPNVPAEEIARSVLELFDSRMISVSSYADESSVPSRCDLSSILDRFVALSHDLEKSSDPRTESLNHVRSNQDLQLSFELTTEGGETWERLAKPDWSRFVMERSDFEIADFYSVNRDLLTAYMGWYTEMNEARILPATVEWNSRKDSEIVYWKKMPLVHHAFCRLEVKSAAEVPKWLWDWYVSATAWYTDPWELPDWPAD